MTGPVISTPRLTLRPLSTEDFRRWEAFYATPRSRFMGGPMSRAQCWEAFGKAMAHWRSRGFGDWSIERRDTGAYIGNVSLAWAEGWPAPELSWSLLKTATGEGFATEAAGALRDHAFDTLRMRSVVSFINDENAASTAVARRLGAFPDRAIPAPGGDAVVWRHRPAGFRSALTDWFPDLRPGIERIAA